jgi:ribosomal protein S18 acetylase RimI-like enzyme
MNTLQVFDRAYAGQQDLQSMLDLIREKPRDQVADFPGFIDLQEMLALPDIQAHTHIWVGPSDRLACFAILDMDTTSGNLTFEVAPDWKEKGLEDDVLAWAEDVLRQTNPVSSCTFLLETSSRSDNSACIVLLERLGFERQVVGAVHMERPLAGPIEKPQLRPGFIIRPIQGEAEAAAWVRLHRAAHGTEVMTTEYKLGMMRTPTYEPDMDLVVVAPDGTLAAYCVCFIDVEENGLTGRRVGYTDPIATHPDFQRRGLSKALILTGLSLLKERHMETACLGTSNDNIAMQRTAESVGFQITSETFRFGKTIHFG